MSDPFFGIALAAVELKRRAPQEFDQFVVSLKVLEEKCWNDFLAADDKVIFTAQGKTGLIKQLRQKVEDCFKVVETEERRKK